MLIYLDIKIPHLKIAPLVGNLEVGNLEGIRSRPQYRQAGAPGASAINASLFAFVGEQDFSCFVQQWAAWPRHQSLLWCCDPPGDRIKGMVDENKAVQCTLCMLVKCNCHYLSFFISLTSTGERPLWIIGGLHSGIKNILGGFFG